MTKWVYAVGKSIGMNDFCSMVIYLSFCSSQMSCWKILNTKISLGLHRLMCSFLMQPHTHPMYAHLFALCVRWVKAEFIAFKYINLDAEDVLSSAMSMSACQPYQQGLQLFPPPNSLTTNDTPHSPHLLLLWIQITLMLNFYLFLFSNPAWYSFFKSLFLGHYHGPMSLKIIPFKWHQKSSKITFTCANQTCMSHFRCNQIASVKKNVFDLHL